MLGGVCPVVTLIVAACEAWLAAQDGAWPDGFFDARVDQDDAEALRLVCLHVAGVTP